MDAGRSNDEQQQQDKLAAEMDELARQNYWYQMGVNWHHSQAILANQVNWSGQNEDNNDQFFGPLVAPIMPMGQPLLENPGLMAVDHQPGGPIQQQAAQQQEPGQQRPRHQRVSQLAGARQRGGARQAAAQQQPPPRQPSLQPRPQPPLQPRPQPPAQPPAQPPPHQASAPQPARPDKVPCPVHDCALRLQPRMDHLYDHLAENHGYERATREYTTDLKHLKRKTVLTLRTLFVRDARKLAWAKARLLAAEEAIRQAADPSYASSHGLGLTMDAYSIQAATACDKKEPLKAMLVAVRGEMAQQGRLRNQTGVGAAQGSWQQVFDDLVSTFHLARNNVVRRAEQHFFRQLRAAVGDDMAQGVTPAQVELTHQLRLKAGASLPPK